jgi:hypothetical protein
MGHHTGRNYLVVALFLQATAHNAHQGSRLVLAKTDYDFVLLLPEDNIFLLLQL